MKRLSVIIITVVLLLALVSCGPIGGLYLYDDSYTVKKQITQMVCDAITNHDAELLLSLFSDDIVKNTDGLAESIDKLFALCGTDVLDVTAHARSGNDSLNAGEKKLNDSFLVTVITSDIKYYLYLNMRVEDTQHPEKIGLRRLTFCTEEEQPYIIFPYIFSEGINVFSLNEPWYDENALQEGTLYVFNEPITCEPSVLFANLELYPLFPVLDAVGASYTRQATGEIDIEYKGRHLQFTFPQSDLPHYQWIALTDLDNGRELRLCNSDIYHGLYTEIGGNIYLSCSTGSYLCNYLGLLPIVDYETKTLTIINNSHS